MPIKEKTHLKEMILSENGQQLLAIRTYKIQLNKQIQQIDTLKNHLEQTKIRKEEKRNMALEVMIESKSLIPFCLIQRM